MKNILAIFILVSVQAIFSLYSQETNSFIKDKNTIPDSFKTKEALSIELVDNNTGMTLYFNPSIDLDDAIQLFGPFQDEISFDGDPRNRTYVWTKNGSIFIISLRDKKELIQVYVRLNAPFSMPGTKPLPWTMKYMEENFGEYGKPYGNESLKLIPYLNEKMPFTRFDYDVSKDQITGFQIFGPWRDNIEKKRNGLKIRE